MRYGISISVIVGRDLDSYVLRTFDSGVALKPSEGGISFLRNAERHVAAFGGQRMLPDGAVEVALFQVQPESQGHGLGLGAMIIRELIDIMRKLG